MADAGTAYGLLRLGDNESDRAVIILHGIRQTRESLRGFAEAVQQALGISRELYLYGYNHTLGLEENGLILAEAIDRELEGKRVDMIGYSMGGLVARLAASEHLPSAVHTIVTLATPNRGSVSNAELTMLGQIGRGIFEMISPLAPRTAGVKDLTRVAKIMSDRRTRLLRSVEGGRLTAGRRRYASIPGLFYHADNSEFAFGPSITISGVQALLKLSALRLKLVNMKRSHDGIVTERSNSLAASETHEFTEISLTRDADDGSPALCHAVADSCRIYDHSSIIGDPMVARLAAALVACDDWRQLRKTDPELDLRTRLYPFDSQ